MCQHYDPNSVNTTLRILPKKCLAITRQTAPWQAVLAYRFEIQTAACSSFYVANGDNCAPFATYNDCIQACGSFF
ncbi:hypothetical protein DSO57_1021830 [Entomophthora muscae]|uniref:Uncharacterized protein n=1 Tax=Entomophthora muscae TaxID=34485 RepID=A0ACC2UP58_9FUNG|nr:hypothetical protein DSO57_1021830 [Entomophthora muscae]